MPPRGYYFGMRWRLDRVIFGGSVPDEIPDRQEFEILLGRARWGAFLCILMFVLAAVATGLLPFSPPPPPGRQY
jgi:hypothetical protein